MKEQPVQCPYHKGIIKIDVEWAAKNGRVFCESCCKAFSVEVQKQEPEVEEILKKFDEGVKEILEEESEPNFYWDDF